MESCSCTHKHVQHVMTQQNVIKIKVIKVLQKSDKCQTQKNKIQFLPWQCNNYGKRGLLNVWSHGPVLSTFSRSHHVRAYFSHIRFLGPTTSLKLSFKHNCYPSLKGAMASSLKTKINAALPLNTGAKKQAIKIIFMSFMTYRNGNRTGTCFNDSVLSKSKWSFFFHKTEHIIPKLTSYSV